MRRPCQTFLSGKKIKQENFILPLLTLSLCSILTSSTTRFISNINTASFPSSIPISLCYSFSLLFTTAACLLRSLFNWCDISRSSDVAVARRLCASFQTAHVSALPLPHTLASSASSPSPFTPCLCFITTSRNSATERERRLNEVRVGWFVARGGRVDVWVWMEGAFYKAGSENLNVCLGCGSDIELRLFLDSVGATEALNKLLLELFYCATNGNDWMGSFDK